MDKNKLYKEMGHRIRDGRKKSHLSQEQLAEMMNVTPQMIINAENGTNGIRPENIIKFCEALDISCDYLLTGKGDHADYSAIIKYSEALSSENIETVIKLLRALQRFAESDSKRCDLE